MENLTQQTIDMLDDLIINIVGLRTECLILPYSVCSEIIKKAQINLIIISEGFRNAE